MRYLSDIHLEFIKPNKLDKFMKQIKPNNDEICVLAGDIGYSYSNNYLKFMEYINKSFKKTFVIAGNHEYYKNDKTIDETNNYLTDLFKQFNNITFFNNSYEIYENHCYVGSTLWSNITNPEYEINDLHSIKELNITKYNDLNKECINFLEQTLQKEDINNVVMITHHMPSRGLINAKYFAPNMVDYNQWFYSNMDNFILKHKDKLKCWIYGHTHTPSVCKIHNIPFLCNPIGYPDENTECDYNKCFSAPH